MKFLYISPDFPLNYHNFTLQLARHGVQVFGLGETPFYDLPPQLRESLRWYEHVNLKEMDQVLGVARALSDKVPNLDRFDMCESHNEFWLDLEATLNEALQIPGVTPTQLKRWKHKSLMKETFRAGGLTVARGGLVPTLEEAQELAEELRFPVILKPDTGVGGNGVHKVHSSEQLTQLFPSFTEPYLMEEFIEGGIITYDGLTDLTGEVIYDSSLNLSHGILDYLKGQDIAFYSARTIDPELTRLGRKVVSLFGLERKFFHIEFFRRGDDYIPIEINARPPGGPILDLMNHALESDLYHHYAHLIARGSAEIPAEKKHYCAYISRKGGDHALSHEALLHRHGHALVEYVENHPLYWEAMGRHRYIFRSPSHEQIREVLADAVRR